MKSPRHLLDAVSRLDLDVVAGLFDCLRDVVFFVKNGEGRYLAVNRTLVERCGLQNPRQLIGRIARDVFREPFGDRFTEQDLAVVATGEPLVDCLELHLYPTRDPGWCVTNKLPLRDAHGRITGLIGVSQDLRVPDYDAPEFEQLAAAVRYAETHLSQRLSPGDLATRAGMSPYQLDRRIRRVFGMSTGQWLIKLRMDTAERLLRESNRSIVEVALETGYADQSAFARQFKTSTGLTPRDYRRTATRR